MWQLYMETADVSDNVLTCKSAAITVALREWTSPFAPSLLRG